MFDLTPCPGEPLISMADIVKTFKTPAGEFTALKKVTACFYPGEFVSVVGKSGSGKSTLVNMLTGIDHPSAGRVRVGQTYIHDLNESDMSLWRGRNLGIVFQFFQLLPMLSLLENVVLPMDLCNVHAPAEREARAMDLLRLVGLEEHAHDLPEAVSGGQQQSAAIARALANDPPILIADEPTGNLDSRTAEAVFEIFGELARQGKTVIMVTHEPGLARRTDRSMLLSDGELIQEQLARSLPDLPHSRLLWLTHQFQAHSLKPGETIDAPGGPDFGLMLVTSGSLRVIFTQNGHPQPPAPGSLAAGDYFSALDFGFAGETLARLQTAKDTEVEVLILKQAEFNQWMEAAPADRQILEIVVCQRFSAWLPDDHRLSKGLL